jgi:hypothetical protein
MSAARSTTFQTPGCSSWHPLGSHWCLVAMRHVIVSAAAGVAKTAERMTTERSIAMLSVTNRVYMPALSSFDDIPGHRLRPAW